MAVVTVADRVKMSREVWTSTRLEKQFYDQNPVLDKIKRTKKFTIGQSAKVPMHTGRSGGITVTGPAGTPTLNGPGRQLTDTAEFGISYNWGYIGHEFGTLNQVHGGAVSFGSSLNLEMEGIVNDIDNSVMRQLAGRGGGLICECTTGGPSTTVNLEPVSGFNAISRGHIYAGLPISIGTAASEGSVVADRTITRVIESETAPQIVISGAAVSTAAGDFVSLKQSRVGAASVEMSSLVEIAGSTAALGGKDPSVAGNEYWQPVVDSTTTVLSLPFIRKLYRRIHQRGGGKPDTVWTSLDLVDAYEELLQNQVRFQPGKLSDGADLKFRNLEWYGDVRLYSRNLHMLTLSDFVLVKGEYEKPTWMSEVQGTNQGMVWDQGSTTFVDAICYSLGIGVHRRNTHGSATALIAD